MLQRSPTYLAYVPSTEESVFHNNKFLPTAVSTFLTRWQKIGFQSLVYWFATKFPRVVRKALLGDVRTFGCIFCWKTFALNLVVSIQGIALNAPACVSRRARTMLNHRCGNSCPNTQAKSLKNTFVRTTIHGANGCVPLRMETYSRSGNAPKFNGHAFPMLSFYLCILTAGSITFLLCVSGSS